MEETKQQRKLENKIAYREAHLASRRTGIEATYGLKIQQAKNDAQRAHWTTIRDRAIKEVDDLEASWLEPLRVEYRAIMGLD